MTTCLFVLFCGVTTEKDSSDHRFSYVYWWQCNGGNVQKNLLDQHFCGNAKKGLLYLLYLSLGLLFNRWRKPK
jgi:hypothetical protein